MRISDWSSDVCSSDLRPAAIVPVLGFGQVMQVHKALAVLFGKYGSTLVRVGLINGLPGFVTREADGEHQTTALDIEDGRVTGTSCMPHPDQLRHLHYQTGPQQRVHISTMQETA